MVVIGQQRWGEAVTVEKFTSNACVFAQHQVSGGNCSKRAQGDIAKVTDGCRDHMKPRSKIDRIDRERPADAGALSGRFLIGRHGGLDANVSGLRGIRTAPVSWLRMLYSLAPPAPIAEDDR
jgi:hypothetical protein